jgi:LPS-assembly lipoprotein
MQTTLGKIIILSIFLSLTGCGFHLRTVTAIPPQLHTLYLQADKQYDDFTVTFKRALKTSGIHLVDTANEAPYTLYLTSSNDYSSTSSGSSYQARVYNLTYSANIYIANQKGKTVLPLKTATVTRSVTLAPNEVFEASNQVLIARHEMQQELANKLFNILGSKKTFLDLSNAK